MYWFAYKEHFIKKNNTIISKCETYLKINENHSNNLKKNQKIKVDKNKFFKIDKEILDHYLINDTEINNYISNIELLAKYNWFKYINFNEDLKKNGIITELDGYNHYIKYGRLENRKIFLKKNNILIKNSLNDEDINNISFNNIDSSKIIVIDNLDYGFHFEIIESIIEKYNIIINIEKNSKNKIYLENIIDKNYILYINKKYPSILINKKINNYNYKIYSTFYEKNLHNYINQVNNFKKNFFIAHEVSYELKKYKNIFYLTPLCNSKNYIYADVLPKIIKKIDCKIPVYIIQGNFDNSRRNYNLLLKILNTNYGKEKIYKIKFLGKGKLPLEIEKYKDKIIIKNNLNFLDYHKEFSDCYYIIPLITKKTHANYYNIKLTSSISYAKGYNLKCLIDKDLQDIYKLNNAEVFNNEEDISDIFKKTLDNFYKK
jgi:hypothetical protein